MGILFFLCCAIASGWYAKVAWEGDALDMCFSLGGWVVCAWCVYATVGTAIIALLGG